MRRPHAPAAAYSDPSLPVAPKLPDEVGAFAEGLKRKKGSDE